MRRFFDETAWSVQLCIGRAGKEKRERCRSGDTASAFGSINKRHFNGYVLLGTFSVVVSLSSSESLYC